MRYLTHISRVFLAVLFVVLISFTTYSAAPIVVSIKVNGVTIIPGPSKTVNVCFNSVYNLQASNTSPTPPTGINIPTEWQNLDSLRGQTGDQINTPDAGRWVATIKYYNTSTSTWTIASDTVKLVYATTSTLQITTTAGVPIAATNIYICGLKDSTFLASPNHTDYKWYKNSTSNLVGTSNSLVFTTALLSSSEPTTSFFVTATNSFGCEVTAQKNFRRDNSFSVNLGPDLVKCSGTNVSLSSPTSPTGILYSYKWNTGQTTTSIVVNTSGTYSLVVTNSGTKCPQSDTVKVAFNAAPIVKITKDTTICNGTSVQLNATVTNGTGTYTYAWTANSDLSATNISNPVATPSIVGLNTYSVIVSDPMGCGGASSVSTKITQLAPFVNPYFGLDPGNDTVVCFNSPAKLNPTILTPSYPSTYTWKWSPITGLSDANIKNPTATLNTAGVFKYVVTATDGRGCKLKDSLNVTNLFELTTTTNFTDTLSCVDTPIVLEAFATGGSGGGYIYNFTPAQGVISGNQLNISLKDSTYLISVSTTDGDGCVSPAVPVNLVGYRPYIQIASGSDTIGYGGNPLVLKADIHNKPSVTVVWYEVFTHSIIAYGLEYTSTSDESVYAFATDNFYTCTNSDTVNITHRLEDLHALFIPNVFSPQATNPENKQLKVYGTLIQENGFNFRIYNQWGQLVYHTTSFVEANSTGWAGDIKSNEGKQSNNVYTYTVEGKFFDGLTFNKTGTATMLH
ncbi:gliding motility-associated C-terminal domain-containing protein [Cytophaga aurantiaca]|uniref:T9SS type B sorting domain-containing protein n=1 Tax=Cytophaga aurantiaca TaxID=29530 RepID=UPI00037E2504|nr:gliding motility-associated C-terminal domain-containing protein [Cytophaga aurantiaca]